MSDPQQPATPPPHPYAGTAKGSPAPRGTGALSIAAMALGLAALVTVIISALYFGWGALLAALLGLAAVGLGIFGLVSRRGRVPAIVGLAAGALSVIAAIAVGAIAGVSLVGALFTHSAPGSGSTPGAASDAPTAEVAWPANMATGGIVFDRDGVVHSDAPDSGEPEATSSDTEVPAIRVYVDYRCPYCSQFETTNGDTLERLASSGQATVEITPLAFLDRVSPDYYSSRASAALACVADAQPEAAWDVNSHLFDPAVQPSETSAGLTNDALADAVDEAAGGLNDEARSCIESEKFVPFAQALNTWVFENPVPGAKDPDTTVTGAPFVLVDGVPYTGRLDDSQEFTDFLADQGMVLGSVS